MSTSDQTYKELAIPFFKEAFNMIDEVLTRLEIPYYLIGVAAIELQLLKESKKPSRGTKDVDFAIMISSIADFENVVDEMVKVGFHKAKAPWTLYHKDFDLAIDLLPFGEIEENDTINFNERYTNLHVLGFKEVMEDAVPAKIEEKSIRLPPLPGMVILKIVAWSDRPEERQNDLVDILYILNHYHKLEYGRIVEFHYDTFPEAENKEIDWHLVSARVMGRDAATFLAKNVKLAERVFKVLKENLNQEKGSPIAQEWARKNKWTIQKAQEVLAELLLGLLDETEKIKGV